MCVICESTNGIQLIRQVELFMLTKRIPPVVVVLPSGGIPSASMQAKVDVPTHFLLTRGVDPPLLEEEIGKLNLKHPGRPESVTPRSVRTPLGEGRDGATRELNRNNKNCSR